MKIKLLVVAAAVVVLSVFSVQPAAAATMEELQAQIQALLAQIAALQAQLNGQGGTVPSPDLITWISGNRASYLPAETISLNIGSADENGRPASSANGYNVQAYIFEASDIDFSNYLTPNPSYSYNGTYDPVSGIWKVAVSAPRSVGSYNLRVSLYCAKDIGTCRSSNVREDSVRTLPFTVTSATTPSSLTLLTPNGGERWMLNSGDKTVITWTPNPQSESVVAYLERIRSGQFVTLGRMIPVAKGSIVWGGELDTAGNYAPTGDGYYVRIVDRATGATDRSNAPFTIVSADYFKVDLKINGSDGPVTIPARGAYVAISWSASDLDGVSCTFMPGDLGQAIYGLSANGYRQVFLKGNPYEYAYAVHMACSSAVGNRSDYVEIPHSGLISSSIRVVSPNGGEVWNAGQPYYVRWVMPTDQRYWTNWFLMPQGTTPRKESGNGSVIDPQVGGYAIGGQSATYPVANASAYVTVPEDIPAGTYKLRAYLSRYESSGQVFNPNTVLARDESDSLFKIASAVTSALACAPSGSSVTTVGVPTAFRAYDPATGAAPGSYVYWSTFDGNPTSGSGNTFSTYFFSTGTKTVTATSNSIGAKCSVNVVQNVSTTLTCSPSTQSAYVGGSVSFRATGGDGSFSWTTAGGVPQTGSGSAFTTSFAVAGVKTVSVSSNSQIASCVVNVNSPTLPPATLTVAAPNGGETYKVGDNLAIRWNATNFSSGQTVYIELRATDGNLKSPVIRVAVAPWGNGYYSWKIPSEVFPGQYKVEIYRADQYGNINPSESVKDLSDAPFSVTAAYLPPPGPAPDGIPTISSISSKGYGISQLAIGQPGYIVGTGFLSSNTLTIDYWSATVASTDGKNIVFTVPSLAAGLHVLQLKNASGDSMQEAVVFFTPATASADGSNAYMASVLNSLQSLVQQISAAFGF